MISHRALAEVGADLNTPAEQWLRRIGSRNNVWIQLVYPV